MDPAEQRAMLQEMGDALLRFGYVSPEELGDRVPSRLCHPLYAVHGNVDEPALQAAPAGVGARFSGHSHLPALERSGRFQAFDPGRPTERRRAPTRCMGLMYAGDRSLRFERVPLPQALRCCVRQLGYLRSMRALFLVYVTLIAAGLAYFTVIGLTHN